MADPDAVDLDININVGLEGVEKLDKLQKKMGETQNVLSNGHDEVAQSANEAAEEMSNMSGGADEASKKFRRLTGVGLGMLFTFRQLAKPFRSLMGQMAEMGGITDELGGILAGPLAKGAEILRDFLRIDDIREFVEEHERWVAIAIIVGGVLFTVASAIGMIIAFAAALSASFISLGTIIAGTLAAALGIIFFWMGTKIPEGISYLMDLLGRLVDGFIEGVKDILAWVGEKLVAGFNILNDTVGDVIRSIIGFFGDIIDYVTGDFIEDIRNIGIVGALINAFEAGKERAIEIVKDLASSVKDLVPDIDMGISGNGAVSRGVSALRGNDFVMQGGNVVRAHPDDTILGFKGDQDGMGGQTVNNIEIEMDASIDSRMDVDKVVDEVERKIDRRTGGRSTIR